MVRIGAAWYVPTPIITYKINEPDVLLRSALNHFFQKKGLRLLSNGFVKYPIPAALGFNEPLAILLPRQQLYSNCDLG